MIKVIMAMGPFGEFGYQGDLPWDHVSEDFQFFKAFTGEHPMFMGAGTWISLPKKLPGRQHIVYVDDINRELPLSADGQYADELVHYQSDHPQAIGAWGSMLKALEEEHGDVVVIGGPEVLLKSMPYADQIAITLMPSDKITGVDVHIDTERLHGILNRRTDMKVSVVEGDIVKIVLYHTPESVAT